MSKTSLFVALALVMVLAPLTGPDLLAQQQGRPQPGATQGGPTDSSDPMPKFNIYYYLGTWEFEWNVPETPLGSGGKVSGFETVTRAFDGRYLEATAEGESPEGKFTSHALMSYLDTPAGQFLTRYEVNSRGLVLLKSGVLGGDMGGWYSHYWETPVFERNGARFQLKGRSYMVSPANYRVNTQISIDGGPFQNFGTIWYSKSIDAPQGPRATGGQ